MLAERAKVDGAEPPAGSAEYDPARLGEMTAVDGTLKPVCGWETTGPLGRFRCRMPKGHEDGEHYGRWTGPEVACGATLTVGPSGDVRCVLPAGHSREHRATSPGVVSWLDAGEEPVSLAGASHVTPADLAAELERGQAPDTPAAVVLDTVAAQPAPASCGAEKTWGTNKGILCDREKGHKGVHSYGGASPHSMTWVGDAEPAAPAHVPHCLNCGLILGSDRSYCDVCGCPVHAPKGRSGAAGRKGTTVSTATAACRG